LNENAGLFYSKVMLSCCMYGGILFDLIDFIVCYLRTSTSSTLTLHLHLHPRQLEEIQGTLLLGLPDSREIILRLHLLTPWLQVQTKLFLKICAEMISK
jgi:hypothetical protein